MQVQPPAAERRRAGLGLALGAPSRDTLIRLGVLAVIVVAGLYFAIWPSPRWHRVQSLGVALAGGIYLAALCRGRLRDTLAVVASLVFCLFAIEIYIVVIDVPRTLDVTTSHTVSWPVLGWGPAKSGVFHHSKIESKTGRVVFDVDYTIDAHLHRQVISAADAPAVIFAGGSDTFGEGLSDADTLPQLFADATGRSFHVVNLGYPGYGPQQFLRGLETGLFDDVVSQPRLFVIEVTPWQVDRTSCLENQIARAPRYEMEDGKPIFHGTCEEGWPIVFRALSHVSSIYRSFISRALQGARPDRIDLFVAILARAGEITRAKYGAQTLVIYQPNEGYLRPAGYTDARLMQRLRDAGLAVVDGGFDPAAFPGENLEIVGEGHPSAVANRAWAALVRDYLDGSPAQSR
ncbi:MAG TPA: hypothetical protein VN808_10555 [Stellaceae bacterium]|nr:hypothetical protein [Stellaceae bacterium]